MSPNYPEKYDSNVDCTIDIEFPENERVQLHFQYFELERHSKCSYDYLEIIDPLDNYGLSTDPMTNTTIYPETIVPEDPSLENITENHTTINPTQISNGNKKCGSILPLPFTSKGNRLKLRFKTDESTTMKGFKIIATLGKSIFQYNFFFF